MAVKRKRVVNREAKFIVIKMWISLDQLKITYANNYLNLVEFRIYNLYNAAHKNYSWKYRNHK